MYWDTQAEYFYIYGIIFISIYSVMMLLFYFRYSKRSGKMMLRMVLFACLQLFIFLIIFIILEWLNIWKIAIYPEEESNPHRYSQMTLFFFFFLTCLICDWLAEFCRFFLIKIVKPKGYIRLVIISLAVSWIQLFLLLTLQQIYENWKWFTFFIVDTHGNFVGDPIYTFMFWFCLFIPEFIAELIRKYKFSKR